MTIARNHRTSAWHSYDQTNHRFDRQIGGCVLRDTIFSTYRVPGTGCPTGLHVIATGDPQTTWPRFRKRTGLILSEPLPRTKTDPSVSWTKWFQVEGSQAFICTE